MELDAVNSTGYQGSNTKISIKPIQTTTSEPTERLNIEPVPKATEEKDSLASDDNKDANLVNVKNGDIKKSISEINSKLNRNTEAIFGIHDATNRVTIKIVDKDTKEVIKEIPPEKTLEMIAKIWEFAGILVDEKL
jgi:flagellar protein FlaG